jgi:hypothetical protein
VKPASGDGRGPAKAEHLHWHIYAVAATTPTTSGAVAQLARAVVPPGHDATPALKSEAVAARGTASDGCDSAQLLTATGTRLSVGEVLFLCLFSEDWFLLLASFHVMALVSSQEKRDACARWHIFSWPPATFLYGPSGRCTVHIVIREDALELAPREL